MINTPWMFVTGSVLIGFMAPEIIAAILKRGVPIGMNFMCAIGFGLIAGAMV